MKILVAPDKFKGTLDASQVADAIIQGIHTVDKNIEGVSFPLADGGDGTAKILTKHLNGEMIKVEVRNPLFKKISSCYGISGDSKTAFIEMSAASGLSLLPEEERNCYYTSSVGTGELILDAVARGAEKIILGIGGSATNDAGIGMAEALGYRMLDKDGNKLEPIGKNLEYLAEIDDTNLRFDLNKLEIHVACDVDNPLYGPNGAAYIYGPQKGADPEQLEKLNRGLINFAEVVKEKYGRNISRVPGAGAAGGLGAGTMVFLNAHLVSGIDLVFDITDFEKQLKNTDLIITGEGRIDEQTKKGKVIHGIINKAVRLNIPVYAVCGVNELDDLTLSRFGIRKCMSLTEYYGSMEKAQKYPVKGIRDITQILLESL